MFRTILNRTDDLLNRIQSRTAQLIIRRFPFLISPRVHLVGRGRLYQRVRFTGYGSIVIGPNFIVGCVDDGGYKGGCLDLNSRYANSRITIGRNVAINNNVVIICGNMVEIGDDVLIGNSVLIMDHSTHGTYPEARRSSIGELRSVVISDNAWVGSRVVILPGSRIGKNSIISAGSVVRGIVPDNSIFAGNPAVLVKTIGE